MDIIEKILRDFIKQLNKNIEYKLIPAGKNSFNNYECNIYNEISFQHELGKYIEKLGYKVLYEKNMYDNKRKEHKNGHDWVKKEVDLVLIKNNEKFAIELKFSKGENARTPENMYDFIKDIKFMEQVKTFRKFTNVYNFIIVNSQKYYKSELNNNKKSNKYDIYKLFRIKSKNKNLREYSIPKKPTDFSCYCKPTGIKKDIEFVLDTKYSGNWEILLNNEQDDDKKIFQYRFILINHNKC